MITRIGFSFALAMSGILVSTYYSHASPGDQFICDAIGDGNYVVTISSQNSKNASATYTIGSENTEADKGESVNLTAEILDDGFKYKGDGIEFVGSNNLAFIIDTQAGVVVKCSIVQKVSAGARTINLPGFSLGGKIRSGPGLNFEQTGSVFGTKPITILNDSGKVMDGYSWFEIKLESGETGFQWGGILCSAGDPIPGVYERCE